MATSSVPHYHSEKFESLNLSALWNEAAGHVDYHLSDPRVESYKTELAATWRGLDPITQRSYIVVAVKKADAQLQHRPLRRVGTAEAYMLLLNNVFELLWVTPNKNQVSRATSGTPRKGASKTPPRRPLPSVREIDADATATVRPLSPAWQRITSGSRRCIPRLHIDLADCQGPVLPGLPSRSPVSPLARFAPITPTDGWEEGEKDMENYTGLVYSDDSDTASEWSYRE